MQTQSDSKVEQIYQCLLGRIQDGDIVVGENLPKEFDLAAEFACGRHTVSQAITRLAHEGLVERRKRAGTRVIRGGLSPEQPVVELDAYALVYPSERHEGIWGVVRGFQDAATDATRRVVGLTTGTDYQRELEIVSRLSEFDVKGAAIYPVIPSAKAQVSLSRMFVESKVPIVLMDLMLPGLDRSSVIVDNFHAGYVMTRHMFDRKLTRVGFLTNHSWAPSVAERYHGYLWAHEEAGITPNSSHVHMEPEMRPDYENPLQDSIALGRRFLARKQNVEGVVCSNDFIARGLIRAALDSGMRVPEDLKISGVDDLTHQFEDDIPLTTYHVPFDSIGRRSFEVLNALVNSDGSPDMINRVRGKIIVRSTA